MKSDKTLNFFYQHPTMCMTTQLAHGNSHKIVIKNIEVFILLAIPQKNRELSFRETMVSFVLSAYESLKASRNLLQRLLACLNFTLDSEDLSIWYKRKKIFL